MNLGDHLKAINNRTEAEANRQRIEREAAECREKREELEKVQRFFKQARERIESAITHGEAPKPVYVGKRGDNYELGYILAGYQPQSVVTCSKHKYHFVWQEFEAWARSNGLLPELQYEHDGVGIESWHALVVKPV